MRKSTEVLLFFSEKLGSLTVHQASKMLWFADKAHLAKWGKVITNEKYIARQYGPVPKETYNRMQLSRDFGHPEDPNSENGEFEVRGYVITGRRKPDLSLLSESEIEVCNNVLNKYGKKSFNELTELSHTSDYKNTPQNKEIKFNDIVDDIDKNGLLKEHLSIAYGG